MKFENILYDKKAGVAKITLNRPDSMNALSPELLAELKKALEDARADKDVRVIVLKANGKAFCAGIDLKMVQGFLDNKSGQGLSKFGDFLRPIVELMEEIEKPIICSVNGLAITGGFLLTYFCDLIIASEDAWFQDTHAKWGFAPGAYESLRLPRLVGMFNAKRIFLTCERITAEEAFRMGLLYKVVAKDKLEEETDKLAADLIKLSGLSQKFMKAQINKGLKVDWETSKVIDDFVRADLLGGFISEDTAERLAPFTKK